MIVNRWSSVNSKHELARIISDSLLSAKRQFSITKTKTFSKRIPSFPSLSNFFSVIHLTPEMRPRRARKKRKEKKKNAAKLINRSRKNEERSSNRRGKYSKHLWRSPVYFAMILLQRARGYSFINYRAFATIECACVFVRRERERGRSRSILSRATRFHRRDLVEKDGRIPEREYIHGISYPRECLINYQNVKWKLA